MSPSLDGLITQALALPPEQRIELAEKLWASIEGSLHEDEELFAEIDRRDAEMQSGVAQTYSHEEVMRDVKKALGE